MSDHLCKCSTSWNRGLSETQVLQVKIRALFDICRKNMESGYCDSALSTLESDIIDVVQE